MRKTLAFLGLGLGVGGLWACSDVRHPSSVTDVEPLRSHVVNCDLKPVLDAARKYLSNPEQTQVSSKLRSMQSAGCGGEANEKLAWEILRTVEDAFVSRRGGPPADGAALVNGVLHCCIPTGSSAVVSPASLGPGGTFGVRGALPGASPLPLSDTDPIVARDPVQIRFGSEDGASVTRPAVYVVRPRPPATWRDVAFGVGVAGTFTDDVMLVHGAPTGPSPHATYRLDEAPDLGFHPGTQVDVIACFTDGDAGPPDPHLPGGDHGFRARMRRGGIVLQTADGVEAYCGQWVWGPLGLARAEEPSRLAALARWAGRVLLPQPLLAAFTDTRSPATSGGAGNFSEFGPLNASTSGGLTFLVAPPTVVENSSTSFPIRILASSGGGNPMEFVQVTLSIQQNQGAPANIVGTFTGCDGLPASAPVGCTQEPDGTVSYQISISKAGGYILCAEGAADGFTFPRVCTGQFHVRN